jgi:hypothetical protein
VFEGRARRKVCGVKTGECSCVMGSLKLAVVFLIRTREEIGDVGFSESFGGKVDEL